MKYKVETHGGELPTDLKTAVERIRALEEDYYDANTAYLYQREKAAFLEDRISELDEQVAYLREAVWERESKD